MTTNQALAAELREAMNSKSGCVSVPNELLLRAAQALSRPEFTESEAMLILDDERTKAEKSNKFSSYWDKEDFAAISAILRAVKEREI